MNQPLPIIIDCDPGIDDAIALMLAFASPEELDVLAVTTVAGNVGLHRTEPNARRIRDLCGAGAVPVLAGCPRPLLRAPVTADDVHGESGLEGSGLPKPAGAPDPRHAVDFLRETVKARPGEITIIAVGPLTNLALALVQRPELASEIRRIVIMGGSAGSGNVTPHAEFNFHVDPHAARIVFESGAAISMYGLDITRQVRAESQWLEAIEALGSPVARAAVGMLEHYRSHGGSLHDVLAVGHLLRPQDFVLEPCRVRIETDDPVLLGKSHVERGVDPADVNAEVGFHADAPAFLAFLESRLARYAVRYGYRSFGRVTGASRSSVRMRVSNSRTGDAHAAMVPSAEKRGGGRNGRPPS
jgi:purine nucleosidase